MVPDRREEQRNSVIRKADRESQCGRSYYIPARRRESEDGVGKSPDAVCPTINDFFFSFLSVPGSQEEGRRWEFSAFTSAFSLTQLLQTLKHEGGKANLDYCLGTLCDEAGAS